MPEYGYCPKCKSKLCPDDKKYMEVAKVCSYCVTFDNTPDKRFRKLWEAKTKS